MEDKKSTIQTLKELRIYMEIGNIIIEDMQKKFPKMEIGQKYKGEYLPFIIEYVNTFIIKDAKNAIKDNNLKSIKEDLWFEVSFIECFCKWLEEEKKVKPYIYEQNQIKNKKII